MIEIPTVLILGAGSSAHCEYPMGSQLVARLAALRHSNELDNLPEGWTREEADDFLVRLARSGHYSIDAFLEVNPEQADLGKYLIARELKKHEIVDKLYPPNNSGWYQPLLNALLDTRGVDSFAASRLGVITFNYDRSLEAYLYYALQARLRIDAEEAAALLATLPIVHVHGVLGEYPITEYRADCDIQELLDISRQIQIIHEITDNGDGFCNPQFERSHEMLTQAERIYILGFGFHPDNLRRFQFFTPTATEHKKVLATLVGVGTIETQRLHDRLDPLGITRAAFPNAGLGCDRFFTHIASLE